ncbi:shikimate dehydrogenase [Glaciecola punicea]|uniref:acetyltransferase n=1 Tax=Glaciecola punicea TaxID=56804 RepID=UPI0008728D4D|nr:acetyltransferase [Glaciecola punicea]OFA32762.1 shikimate dehydrogenase [Glaciecola punicea]
MSDGVVLIGAGGHASVLLDLLIEQRANILGYISIDIASNEQLFSDFRRFKSDEQINQFDRSMVKLVNGVGSIPGNTLRHDIYNRYKELGYRFATIVSQNAIVSKYAQLAEGVQVMHGAIIQAGVSVGCNSIVNTGAIIEHDCTIGNNNHIAPGVTISGNVTSQSNVHFGTGSSVIQLVDIDENVIIGAGATITKNVEKNSICYPARIFKQAIE